jgi:probable phosphomutase (TIGR03848 family)
VAIVLLIRHGRTRANAAGVLAGRAPGVELDEAGIAQARGLAGRLAGVPLTAVVHSPLERCARTAGHLLDGRDDTQVHVDDRLVECDYGDWTGRALAELAKEPLWATIMRSPSQVTFPGGEAMAAMAARGVAAVAEWSTRVGPEATVAIVSHGDVIKAILSHALGQPFDQFQRIAVSPGSLSVVRMGEEAPMVLRMNDTGTPPEAPAPVAAQVGGGAG